MKISEWKIINSKLLLKTRLFSVFEEKSISPRNHKEGSFLIFNFSDWVNVIAVTPEKEIVMIRQFRHGNKRIELEIPGGLMDNIDKNPIEAGLRELKEETGFSGEKAFLIGSVYPNPALQNNQCHTILVLNAKKSSETNLEDCEDIETLLIHEDKLNSMILNGEIRHSIVLNA
ncbi:MAG TPA: NUDIX hydrolase, partial [Victivallales bacterium]|nr:NUDIX hydrolase [Victivallales bacterium]